ncbi:MAG: metallophosphoesterase [Paludisphaera borealis]|uniref:metallophosphoesterase n=1 Tax=Paludisphaera borealis TaxID=1387353 RepID=UPI002840F47D|nr:metallophosphoesterase [Paludisphaera borealis]MDR3621170.1 metallophosphoesterase [Paludisphaera borealis]
MSANGSPCHPHEGWLLTPEAAAIRPEEATAVVADVHLGYEWARGNAGDCVPAHSLAETLDRLGRLLARAEFRKLIVAGDLVESARPCARTADDVFRLNDWLRERGVELVVVPGNHDRSLFWMCARRPKSAAPGPIVAPPELTVAGWTICHGHRPSRGDRVVMGHHHPALVVERFAAPCFLVGPRLMILPAFSPNAAGLNVATAKGAKEWADHDLRCVAGAGVELLDFGPLSTLAARIEGRSPALAPRPRIA